MVKDAFLPRRVWPILMRDISVLDMRIIWEVAIQNRRKISLLLKDSFVEEAAVPNTTSKPEGSWRG